jgi:nitrite reductase/ring-hydroxylating ferredoxin subunit
MSDEMSEKAALCQSESLREGESYGFAILYRGEPCEAILVRFGGHAYCYLNRCVHMGKRLDCEDARIFNDSGEHLRCSMHGVLYDPATGLCLSNPCTGKSLTPVKIDERDGRIHLADKRAVIPR